MGALQLGGIAISLIAIVWSIASRYVGQPDWARYIDAGLHIAEKALPIIAEARLNPDKYKNMTPAQVRAVLMPPDWGDLVEQVEKELGEQKK